MKNEWIEKISMTQAQRRELEEWCACIGYQRYEELFELILKHAPESLNYETLNALARYDFNISDILHSTIKFVELRFRAFLINRFGDTQITKKEYLYQISEALSGYSSKLDCTTYYDKSLKETTSLAEFLNASGMETIFRIFLLLDDDILKEFGERSQLESDFQSIRRLRNFVAHGRLLINNTKLNLKESVQILFRYMPTEQSKLKRINYLNELHERILVSEGHLPESLKEIVKVI